MTRLRREKAQRSNVGKGEGYDVTTWGRKKANRRQDRKGIKLAGDEVEVEQSEHLSRYKLLMRIAVHEIHAQVEADDCG